MQKPQACTQCKRDPAEWALQYIAEDRPTFSTLGSHVRGFRIVARLCWNCKEILLGALARTPTQPAPDLADDTPWRGTHYVLKEYP